MRAVWQRLSEQKPPIRKTKGLRDENGKVQLDTQQTPRRHGIPPENLPQKAKGGEREISPDETWAMREETARTHINPKINNKRENSRIREYFTNKTGKEHREALNGNMRRRSKKSNWPTQQEKNRRGRQHKSRITQAK